MLLTKNDDGVRGWITAVKNGALQTGLTASITVTVIDPDDSASTSPSVTESGLLPGSYYFDVPSSFFTTNGLGWYVVVAVVNASGVKDVSKDALRVFEEDFDTISGGGGLTQQNVRDALKLAPTAGAPAAGSVDEHLDDILADTSAMQPLIDVAISTRLANADYTAPDNANILLIQKILRNRLALADGSTTNWILYDDDGTTPLLTWDVADKDGLGITQPSGVPSRRTRGV